MTRIAHPLYEQTWPDGEYRMFQLGFVVDDLLGQASRWVEVHGVGPFFVMPRFQVPCTYRGNRTEIDMQIAVSQAGPVEIELIKQYCDRPSVYRDVFGESGSGFHQLCTATRDYDGKKAHYESLGYELATEFDVRGQRVAYFDTFADFGFYTEFAEDVPGFLERLARNSATCAQWDGTDPIRILDPDGSGYTTP